MRVKFLDARQHARSERGGVLVMVALWMPLLLLFVVLVVDVGNWFEHKRHLQLQADAGALAGGGVFTIPCADAPIIDETRKYSGDPNVPPPYNSQVGAIDQGNVHVLINSSAYWNESGSDYSDGQPCTAKMIDVKITEANLPLFFGVPGLGFDAVPAINAHARVQIQQLTTSAGALPVGVPDVNPTVARAYVVDENTCGSGSCSVIASTPLTNTGFVGGLSIWDNASAPLDVPVNTSRIGVRIAFGGGSSTTCGNPLVACYDATPPNGILFARGWSASGSGSQPNAPLARAVTLFNGTCSDPYFSSAASSCSIGVRAKLDFGVANPVAPNPPGAIVKASVGGGAQLPLTYNASSGFWESTGGNFFSTASNAGPLDVTLSWEETLGSQGGNTCNTTGGNKCKGTFGVVQRIFRASDARSGPIKLAQIWESGAFWANSFQQGTTHPLVLKIGITGSLANAQSVSDPVVALRVVGGSQNQSLDCDPALSKLRDEIAQGCAPTYTRNTGTACPSSPTALWATVQPWSCVAVQTGSATNQVPAGMNLRVLGSEKPSACTSPNRWNQFPNFPQGDPRIIQVLLTPFGSFEGNGSTTVPVSNFATFYVTGWTGQGMGFNNPCQGSGDDPVPNNDAGYIVGHFIKYVDHLNTGGGGVSCDFTSFGSCVAVLTE